MNFRAFLNADLEDDDDDDIEIPQEEKITITKDLFHFLAEIGDSDMLRKAIFQNEHKEFNPLEPEISINTKNYEDAAPIHIALFNLQFECIKVLLENKANYLEKCGGNPIIHLILSIVNTADNSKYRNELFSLFLKEEKKEQFINQKNYLKQNALLLACYYDDVESIKILLNNQIEISCRDIIGNNAIHITSMFNSYNSLDYLLKNTDNDVLSYNQYNDEFMTPLTLAIQNGNMESLKLLLSQKCLDLKNTDDLYQRSYTQICVEENQYEMKQLFELNFGVRERLKKDDFSIFTHCVCNLHTTCHEQLLNSSNDIPPEKARRIEVLLDAKYNGSLLKNKNIKYTNRRGKIQDILRIHDYNYVYKVQEICKQLNDNELGNYDSDTTVSRDSYEVAIHSIGTVCECIDKILGDFSHLDRGLCIVRPPGHHIGIAGGVGDDLKRSQSTGFCLFNNVVIGSGYIRYNYGHKMIENIAILDMDIHHGNGTEECLRALKPQIVTEKFLSKFGQWECTKPQYKPWLDESDGDHLFFASVHGYSKEKSMNESGDFYPGSGEFFREINKRKFEIDEIGSPIAELPTIINIPITKENAVNNYKWRRYCVDEIFQDLIDFSPDVILLSMGFDGHFMDKINCGYGKLTEYDYFWFTQQIRKIANKCCKGRIISVLEGGYEISGRGLSPFAMSAAYHAKALSTDNRGHYKMGRCDQPAVHNVPVADVIPTRSLRKRKAVDYISFD